MTPPAPISRQRRYQLEHAAKGLCQECSLPAVRGGRCAGHHQARQEKRRSAYRSANPLGVVRPQMCGRCGSSGHNRRTCPEATR
jgi:hypothetical protein